MDHEGNLLGRLGDKDRPFSNHFHPEDYGEVVEGDKAPADVVNKPTSQELWKKYHEQMKEPIDLPKSEYKFGSSPKSTLADKIKSGSGEINPYSSKAYEDALAKGIYHNPPVKEDYVPALHGKSFEEIGKVHGEDFVEGSKDFMKSMITLLKALKE